MSRNSNNQLVEKNLKNNRVENASTHILRTGLTPGYKKINMANATYFTRRAGGFLGPGAMPADGRTWFMTLAAKFN